MSEEKPLAVVESYEPATGEQTRFKLDCKVNKNQRWGMDIPRDVAEELYVKLGARLWEAKRSNTVSLEDRALLRDDYHVNPRIVRCAADDCAQHFSLPEIDNRHPWLVAQERGWKRIKNSTDLLCPDSVRELPNLVD